MCMAIAVCLFQEEVHRILGSSTKINSIRVEAYSQVHVHFLEQRSCQDEVKHPQCLKESHSDPICFLQWLSMNFYPHSRRLNEMPISQDTVTRATTQNDLRLKIFASGKAAVATIPGPLFSPDFCASWDLQVNRFSSCPTKRSVVENAYIPDTTTVEYAAREKAVVNRLPKRIFVGSNQVLSKRNERKGRNLNRCLKSATSTLHQVAWSKSNLITTLETLHNPDLCTCLI